MASHSPVPQVTAPFARIRAAVGVTPEQMVNGLKVGASQSQRPQSALLNWPVSVEVQPSADVQVIVYSPVHSPPAGLETQCILVIAGVASQLHSTTPNSMICAVVGSMLPGQLSGGREKAMKDISHGFPMFTIPVPVAMQPSSVLQVMV